MFGGRGARGHVCDGLEAWTMNHHNCNRATAKVGTHGFTAGGRAPTKPREYAYRTFSVGIFRWDVENLGLGTVKKSAAEVRVSGPTSNPEAVYAKARAIVAELDAGTYSGPKRVSM